MRISTEEDISWLDCFQCKVHSSLELLHDYLHLERVFQKEDQVLLERKYKRKGEELSFEVSKIGKDDLVSKWADDIFCFSLDIFKARFTDQKSIVIKEWKIILRNDFLLYFKFFLTETTIYLKVMCSVVCIIIFIRLWFKEIYV